MKITEINAFIKFVKNLGNYQTLAVESGLIAQVDESTENVHAAYKEAYDIVKAQIKENVKNKQEVEG